jgi:hypothetical protein
VVRSVYQGRLTNWSTFLAAFTEYRETYFHNMSFEEFVDIEEKNSLRLSEAAHEKLT